MAAETELARLFLEHSCKKLFKEWWPRMKSAVEGLSEEQIWWRPNTESNSVGNLLLHLNGNVHQWLVDSFNRQEDKRERAAEFNARSGRSGQELIEKLGTTLDEAARVLARLTGDDLLTPFEIQGYHVTGLDAVYQVVEHFGLHYGQIVYVTKALQGKDLGFYQELKETGRAS
ncbi:MAG TPA: DUF1572 family protein [Terracidiphilus sp.]|jgi:uncharacterized damage-inducible protein DinB